MFDLLLIDCIGYEEVSLTKGNRELNESDEAIIQTIRDHYWAERKKEERTVIFLLRFMLKLLFTPVSLVLALFVWFFTWLVCVSSVVLGLASAVLSLLALAILLLSASVEGFIIYLVLAFLASPFGLPAAAFWLLGRGARSAVFHSGKDLWLNHEEKTRSLLQGMW